MDLSLVQTQIGLAAHAHSVYTKLREHGLEQPASVLKAELARFVRALDEVVRHPDMGKIPPSDEFLVSWRALLGLGDAMRMSIVRNEVLCLGASLH